MRPWRHPGINFGAALLVLAGLVAESLHGPHCHRGDAACHAVSTPPAADSAHADHHGCGEHAHHDQSTATHSNSNTARNSASQLVIGIRAFGCDDASDCAICRFLAQSSFTPSAKSHVVALAPVGQETLADHSAPTLRRLSQTRSRAPPAHG